MKPFRSWIRFLWRGHVVAAIGAGHLAVLLASGCSDPTDFVVDVDLEGTVLLDGTPLPSARVILRDQRTVAEVGAVMGIATADAGGHYRLRARAERPGYSPSCDFLVLYVEGYRFSTGLSTELLCTEQRQAIDLLLTESGGSPARTGAASHR